MAHNSSNRCSQRMAVLLKWFPTMPVGPADTADAGEQTDSRRRALLLLAAIGLAFVVLRFPLMYRQPGDMDEEYYAIPGLAILESGIPRLPHVVQRNPNGAFHLADEAFFAEPPLYFYWQAACYALLPDVYGTGRLASAVAGLVSLWLVYELARTLYRSERTAVVAAGLYCFARTFYRPATTARPDMMCTMFGLAALLCVAKWHKTRAHGWLWGVGVLLGLGALTHPVAIVFALQAAVWILLASRGRGRLTNPLLVGGTALAVFLLWTPLIIANPEAFRAQFFNNILGRAGPGLVHRLVVFWPWLEFQGLRLLELLLLPQFVVLIGGTVVATVRDLRRLATGPVIAWLMAWSSLFLLCTMSGRHPTFYHWSYPTAWLAICTGRALVSLYDWNSRTLWQRGLAWAGAALVVIVMSKGTGLRAWTAHLAHWDDVNYNAPAFARRIMADFPADATYLVDREYVLDFYAAGRDTLIAPVRPFYPRVWREYDYLVVSRYGLEWGTPADMQAERIRAYGDRQDLFACYAEVYRAPDGGDDGE